MKIRITELFGIQPPIILSGMSWISVPKMVAAVSNAVGLGIAARGGMGIILETIALETNFITPIIFTALVLMSIITSISAGFIKFFMEPISENFQSYIQIG